LQDLIGSDCPNATTGDCDFNPITIFAPTNTAFQRLAAAQNVTVADLLDLPVNQASAVAGNGVEGGIDTRA